MKRGAYRSVGPRRRGALAPAWVPLYVALAVAPAVTVFALATTALGGASTEAWGVREAHAESATDIVTSPVAARTPAAAPGPGSNPAPVAAVAGAETPAPVVDAVGAVGLTVADLARSVAFFRDVLGFRVVSQGDASGAAVASLEGVPGARTRSARLALGDESIVLTEYLSPRGRAVPGDLHSNDLAFQHLAIVVADMTRAYQRLRDHHVAPVSTEPQTLPAWNQNAGGIKAYYFSDPDNHTLELIWFPAGKGDPRWQRSASAATTAAAQSPAPLFLGIDHTAIAVASTDDSLALYRDHLGFRVAGASENWGTEQEHLNNVFGAHLRITGLRAAAGPGIELLEYLTPRDGRRAPSNLRANDLLHWQTFLHATDPAAAVTQVVAAGGKRVSPRVVELADAAWTSGRAVLLRDRDGHGLLLGR